MGHGKLHRQSVYGPSDRELWIRKTAIDTFSILDSAREGRVTAFTMHLAFAGLGVSRSVADVKKMFHRLKGVKFDEEIDALDLQDFIALTDIYDGNVFGEGVSLRLLTFVLRRQENLHRLLNRTYQPPANRPKKRWDFRRGSLHDDREEEEEEDCPVILPDLRTPSAAPQKRSMRGNRTPSTPASLSRMRRRWDASDRTIDLGEIVDELKDFGIKMEHPDFQSQTQSPDLNFVEPRSRSRTKRMPEVRHDLAFQFYSRHMRSHLASRRSTGLNEFFVEKITRDPIGELRNFTAYPRVSRHSSQLM